MNDGPASNGMVEQLPSSLWFMAVEVLVVHEPQGAGAPQHVGSTDDGLSVWAEHASHKVFSTTAPRPVNPLQRQPLWPAASTPVAVRVPATMQGGTSMIQLAFRSSALPANLQPASCAVQWAAESAAAKLRAGLLADVNVSGMFGTYSRACLHPDPILPLQHSELFVLQPGTTQ